MQFKKNKNKTKAIIITIPIILLYFHKSEKV